MTAKSTETKILDTRQSLSDGWGRLCSVPLVEPASFSCQELVTSSAADNEYRINASRHTRPQHSAKRTPPQELEYYARVRDRVLLT